MEHLGTNPAELTRASGPSCRRLSQARHRAEVWPEGGGPRPPREQCWWPVSTSLSRAPAVCLGIPPCRGGTSVLVPLVFRGNTSQVHCRPAQGPWLLLCAVLVNFCCYDKTPRLKVTVEEKIYWGLRFERDKSSSWREAWQQGGRHVACAEGSESSERSYAQLQA